MHLLRINEIHVTNIKVAKCREGAQVSVAMVHLPLLVFELPYQVINEIRCPCSCCK